MPYPKNEEKLKSWETAISSEIASDPKPWNDYDTQIQVVCSTYDRHLSGTSGYKPLNWQLIKAITWVETGAAITAWKTAPMQIGVNGDPGLNDLLNTPNGKMILPPEYTKTLTLSNVPTNGNLNIEAGVGYFLKIMAIFGMQADKTPPGTTSGKPVTASHPAASPPESPQKHLASQKHLAPQKHPAPKKHLAIVGWRAETLQYIAQHYNAGDANYADKLQYALDIITGKVTPKAATPKAKDAHKTPAVKHPAVPMRIPVHARH